MKNNAYILIIFTILFLSNCSRDNNLPTDGNPDVDIENLINDTDLFILKSEKISRSEYQIFPITHFLDKGYSFGKDKDGLASNLIFVNIDTREKKILFDSIPAIITEYPGSEQYIYLSEAERKLLDTEKRKDDFIFIIAKTEDYNNNGKIDIGDPNGLYFCDSNGENLTRLSPYGLDVYNWKFINTNKSILEVRCIMDINDDKKFNNYDEQKIFHIKLDSTSHSVYDIFDENFKNEIKENYIQNRQQG